MKNNKDIFLVILIFLNVIILYLLISSKNKDPYVRTFKDVNIVTGKEETFERFAFKCKVFDTDDQYHIYEARLPGFKELKVKDIIPSGILTISVTKPKNKKNFMYLGSNLFNEKGAYITLEAHRYQNSAIWNNKFYGYSMSEEKYEANKKGKKTKNIPSYAFSGSLFTMKTHQPRPDIEKANPNTYETEKRTPQKNDSIESGFYSLNRRGVNYRSEIYLQPVDTYKSTNYDIPSYELPFDKEQYKDAYYEKKVFIDISNYVFALTMSMAEGITYNYYKSPKNKSDAFVNYQFTIRGNCERIPLNYF